MVVVSIIRNKYLAVSIGVEGFGMFNLISSFFLFLGYFSGIWLESPTIKYLSEYNSDNDIVSVQKVFDFSFSIVAILTIIVFCVVIIFSSVIKYYFLSPDIPFTYFSLFAASFIATRLTSVFQATFQAFKLVKKTAVIRIYSNIVNLLSIIILVYFFDLLGFFISIFISSVIILLLFWRDAKNIIVIKIKKPVFKDNISKKMIKFIKVGLYLSFINNTSEYLKRFIIVSFSNISTLGLYHASFGLTKYLGIVSQSALFYYRPKMSENICIENRNSVLNNYLRIILLSGTVFSTVSILFGKLAIKVLYAESFLSLANVLYIFIIAQLLVNIQMGFQAITVGIARLKIHSLATTLSHLITIAVPFIFLKKYGLITLGIGTIVASVLHSFINYFYLKKRIGIILTSDNINLLVISGLSIWIAVVMVDVLIYFKFVIILLLLISLFFQLNIEEKYSIKMLLIRIMNRVKK